MARKQKLSTKELKIPNRTFTSKAIPYQVLDEQAVIKKALEDNKVAEQEKVLLAKELEKPFGKRNQALMNKYRAQVREVLNGYPLDYSTNNYNIIATAVDDGDVKVEERPTPYWVEIIIPDNGRGDKYTFKFPIKHEPVVDGAQIFKLDGINTWIYADGSLVDSMTDDITPYTILYAFHKGDKKPAKEFLHNGAYIFNFQGFYINYTRIPKAKTAASSTTTPPPSTKVQKDDPQYFYVADEFINGDKISSALIRGIYNNAAKNGVVSGLKNAIPKDKVVLVDIKAGKKKSDNIWIYFDYIEDEMIHATILSGAVEAASHMGLKRASIEQINMKITAHNQKVADQFLNPPLDQ